MFALRRVYFIDKTTTITVADNPEIPDAVSREHRQSQRFSVINEARQTERKKRQHDEKGGWEDSAVAFLMLPMLPSCFKLCPSPVFLPASLPSRLPV